MVVMCGVPVPIVDVVDVIAVRDGNVSAVRAVGVVVPVVNAVFGRLAVVEMPIVRPVQMSVVDVVDVIAMRDGDVPAPVGVRVVVAEMFAVVGHDRIPLVLASHPVLILPPPGHSRTPVRRRVDATIPTLRGAFCRDR